MKDSENLLRLMPTLIKSIKKSIPQVRSRHTARELAAITMKVIDELKKMGAF